MSLLSIVLAALVIVILYLVVKWLLAKLKVNVDNDILVVGALILFVLVLLGKVNLGI